MGDPWYLYLWLILQLYYEPALHSSLSHPPSVLITISSFHFILNGACKYFIYSIHRQSRRILNMNGSSNWVCAIPSSTRKEGTRGMKKDATGSTSLLLFLRRPRLNRRRKRNHFWFDSTRLNLRKKSKFIKLISNLIKQSFDPLMQRWAWKRTKWKENCYLINGPAGNENRSWL